MSRGERQARAGLGLGVVVLATVAGLLAQTARPAREIERYCQDVEEGVRKIARNTDAGQLLTRTGELAAAAPELAGSYLRRLG